MVAKQDSCLINGKEPHYMFIYDGFPKSIRDRLKDAKYDICCACLEYIPQGMPYSVVENCSCKEEVLHRKLDWILERLDDGA